MTKRLSLARNGFDRRSDLDFSDDGSYFVGYSYKGLPITYCKYDDIYYLSIRVDYIIHDHSFTHDDWRATDEYRLEDEFNGKSEVDTAKLIENCEKILKKIDELDAKVANEVIDSAPIIERLQAEVNFVEEAIDTFKKNFKWYEASEYKLRSLRDYMNSSASKLERMKVMLSELTTNTVDSKKLRYWSQHLASYGYVEAKEDDFYLREMREALGE